MKVWKDREGKSVTASEFMARWKQGIAKVTPLQQMVSSIVGYCIVTIGVLLGIVTALIFRQWWLLIVLLGSLVITATQFLGTLQRYFIIKELESFSGVEPEIIIDKEVSNGKESAV